MAKFDESKVINALHTDKAEIGKKYYFANYIKDLRDIVIQNSRAEILTDIDKDRIPFRVEGWDNNTWQFCYPYEEPKKKYVPYTWEDRNILRGKWIKIKIKITKKCKLSQSKKMNVFR